jgi:hypothetical protein
MSSTFPPTCAAAAVAGSSKEAPWFDVLLGKRLGSPGAIWGFFFFWGGRRDFSQRRQDRQEEMTQRKKEKKKMEKCEQNH